MTAPFLNNMQEDDPSGSWGRCHTHREPPYSSAEGHVHASRWKWWWDWLWGTPRHTHSFVQQRWVEDPSKHKHTCRLGSIYNILYMHAHWQRWLIDLHAWMWIVKYDWFLLSPHSLSLSLSHTHTHTHTHTNTHRYEYLSVLYWCLPGHDSHAWRK